MRPRNFFKILSLLICPVMAWSQPQAEWCDHPGTIVLPDGTERTGVIRTYGSDLAPWHFQSEVRFMDSTTWMGLTKVKRKDFTAYEPKDLKGYRLHDLHMAYLAKPYADLTSVSLKMIKKQYFMRAISVGRLNLFHYFDAPPSMYVGSEEEYERLREESAVNNYVLLEKEAGKLKNITDVDLRKLIGDCPAVLKKYEEGHYGPSPLDKGEKRGLGKFVARVVDSNIMKAYATPLIEDYNDTCPL
jgi:hypothetical protein